MNRSQRIVLVSGAAALLLVLFTTPSYQHGLHGLVFSENYSRDFANVWDWGTALVRSAIVTAATAALYSVFKKP